MSYLPANEQIASLVYLSQVTNDVVQCRQPLPDGSESPITQAHFTWNSPDFGSNKKQRQ